MDLPVLPPLAPMLARLVPSIPDVLHAEPKWDGFRTMVFRDGDEVVLSSRNTLPLTQYFPEVVTALREQLPPRCVLDGEIVLMTDGGLDFAALQQRIHPAASRIELLARETPAAFIGFDLLALGDALFTGVALRERRARLVEVLADARAPVFLTPATSDLKRAQDWFTRFEGAGLDGVVLKPPTGEYLPGKRGWFKVKHQRTADCVVAGFRWHKKEPVLGSLLLGLYDAAGDLRHVGVAASFPMERRRELITELEPLIETDPEAHPWAEWQRSLLSGRSETVSRWNAGKNLSFVPLRPERVAEVHYEHMEGDRFRHTAQFLRWRFDRDPRSCDYSQLERPADVNLDAILPLST